MTTNTPQPRSFWSLFSEPAERPPNSSSFWRLFSTEPVRREHCFVHAKRFDGELVFWTKRSLKASVGGKSTMVYGAAGSPNATTVGPLLRSFAARVESNREMPDRSIRFDGNRHPTSVLTDFNPLPKDQNVWLLNPYDRAAGIWDLGQTVRTPEMAVALAELLIPIKDLAGRSYFNEAAFGLVFAVVLALNHIAGTHWTFRDLFRALDSPGSIAKTTSGLPDASRRVTRILEDEQNLPAILITLSAKLSAFEMAADLRGTTCMNLWLLTGVLNQGRLN